MLTIRFYRLGRVWSVAAVEVIDGGGSLFIWGCEKPTFGECCLAAANFVQCYEADTACPGTPA